MHTDTYQTGYCIKQNFSIIDAIEKIFIGIFDKVILQPNEGNVREDLVYWFGCGLHACAHYYKNICEI